MKTKLSRGGRQYRKLTKKEVTELNDGNIAGMTWYKGKLEWNKDIEYILLPGTGSTVLAIPKDEILSNIVDKRITNWIS